MPKPTVCSQGGFTLIEVLVAAAIVATGISVLAALFIVAIVVNRTARTTTFATVLAQQKMEQLRGLTWGFDVLGGPASDLTTDVSIVPFTRGGAGLSPSPPDTLTHNTAGYVDYVDGAGNWIGTGASVPDRKSVV
jgi:prepilin-type N-terminal cleavage/methylation domain-containing protein